MCGCLSLEFVYIGDVHMYRGCAGMGHQAMHACPHKDHVHIRE